MEEKKSSILPTDWFQWNPAHTPPTGKVDILMASGLVGKNLLSTQVRWSHDYGLTPTAVVAWRPAIKE